MEAHEIEIGEHINFAYKGGRKVEGLVTGVGDKVVQLTLHTDYKGKNEEWFAGESKQFNKGEMKKIRLIK